MSRAQKNIMGSASGRHGRKTTDLRNQMYKTCVAYSRLILCSFALLVSSCVYYVAIRSHTIELSFDQLSAFERQVQTIGNNSVYVVEPPKRDEILSSLPREDWAKLSSRIEYVAFVYDEMYSVIGSGTWIAEVSTLLSKMQPPGYGVVLFSCGCVVPNIVFTKTHIRFDGNECTMLPGFVFGKESVRFMDVKLPTLRCRNRDRVLSSRWYETNAWKLEDARSEHEALRKKLLSGER